MERVKQLLNNSTFIAIVYIVVTLLITIQSYNAAPKFFDGVACTGYNNYLIFKASFYNLIQDADLYKLYPDLYWDLYKYSPTFALGMAPMAVLPDFLGLFIWNLLNAMVLFWALYRFPSGNQNVNSFMLWFVLIELVTSLQNSQSNGLIAGLTILAFSFLERRQIFWACLFIVLTVYIKIFGIVTFVLFLFYPEKIKFIAYTIFWTVLLLFLPLLVISPDQLQFLYASWGDLLQADHSASYGFSVMGWLHSWFGLDLSKNVVVLVGILLFCLPLVRIKNYSALGFRLLMLCSAMLWVVIFNHKAESPTFIIAMSGAALWYFSQKQKGLNTGLIIAAFIFTSLSPTDVFPRFIRNEYLVPYVFKAVFCILIWLKIIIELNRTSYELKTTFDRDL